MGEQNISEKRYVVGLMSGTSVDGIDAALVEISGSPQSPKVHLKAFDNTPFPSSVREKIFRLFDPKTADVESIGYMNFLLGELYADASLAIMKKAGLQPEDVYAIGSHGQTIWHAPVYEAPDGVPVHYTVQIGEGSVIALKTGVPTVSDFRTADMAAGGQGAPLVPFTEYLLYRKQEETVLLQNIGGIGNITVIPAGCGPEKVFAFDTGPGNMIIDAAVCAITGGKENCDLGGARAARGKVCEEMLQYLQQDPYYTKELPKSTGREYFGVQYTDTIRGMQKELAISDDDLIATVTDLTAWSIADAYERYILPALGGKSSPLAAKQLVVGGGGSYNQTLMTFLARRMEAFGVQVCTQEAVGGNSDAKEAVAFALLADRCMHGLCGNLPSVTGAKLPVVMGKISLPPAGWK